MRRRLSSNTPAVQRRLKQLLKLPSLQGMSMACYMAVEALVRSGAVDDVFVEDGDILFVSVPEYKARDPQVQQWLALVPKVCAREEDEPPFVVAGDMWGPPDDKGLGVGAIWYGMGGRKKADTAVWVRHHAFGEFYVSQYQHMGAAGFDEDSYDKRNPFMVETAAVEAYGFRQAAANGIKVLGEHGGDVEYESQLP